MESNKLTWDVYLDDIYKLVDKIVANGVTCSGVLGHNKDGLIPATIIASKLSVEVLDGFRAISEITHGGSILIVCGVISSGISLISLRSNIIATVYHRISANQVIQPNFYVSKSTNYIQFPYE